MKRLSLAAVGAVALAASVLPLSGIAAAADPVNADLAVTPAGTKKATAAWSAGTPLTAGTLDAYLVTVDDDPNSAPLGADRSRFVDAGATLSVAFDDLSSATTYHFNVYAVDYKETGIDILEPVSDPAPNTPIGTLAAKGSTLTINQSAMIVPNGNSVTLNGSLVNEANAAIPGVEIVIQKNPYPFGDGWIEDAAQNTTTTATGQWTKSFTPNVNTQYRAFYRPTNDIGGWTRNVTVEVRKKLVAAVAPGTKILAGKKLSFTGRLPAVPDVATYYGDNTVQVCIQYFTTGVWKKRTCTDAAANGDFLVEIRPGVDADGKYRVWSGLGEAYADSFSKARTITIT